MVRHPARSAASPRASRYVREKARAEGSELSRVKDALTLRGLSPRKRFGQNFLVREDLAERIVEQSHLTADDVVIEIGPGAGALTPRIAPRVRHLLAIEKDIGLAELLTEELAGIPHLEIVQGDFLALDIAAVARANNAERIVIVGNIPYNITTPIIEHIFVHRENVRSAVLLVQKEYGQRLGAAAGTPEYGSLTLFARYHALLEPLMNIRAPAFWPRPDVDSMLIRFFIREKPPVDVPSEDLMFTIIRGSFQMRRKQLMNTLQGALGLPREQIERLCRHAGVAPQRRGETLTLEEFARLTRAAAPYVRDD